MANIELIQTITHQSQKTNQEIKPLYLKLKSDLQHYGESKEAISIIYS